MDEDLAAMAKIAADSAVDTVFSSMMAKLDNQINATAGDATASPSASGGAGPKQGPASPLYQAELLDPAVREPLFARIEAEQAAELAAKTEERQQAKNKAERYSKTTALLRRAQLLEEQLKQKAAAGKPDEMDGGFTHMDKIDAVEGYKASRARGMEEGFGDGFRAEGEEGAEDDLGQVQDQPRLTRRGREHLGLRRGDGMGRVPLEGINPEEAAQIEETIRHAEQAKRNVRRYKREAEARRKRRLMIEAAEADALKAQIRATEERRRIAAESAEDTRARKLKERLEKSRRERAERKRRREELFAAEKRMRQLKHKPLHLRMKEDYKKRVELPELQRRKKKLADIHRRFTENSPDTAELEMRTRAHQAIQRLSGERDHHRVKGRERTWMETRVWYHGEAKRRVLKEDAEKRTALQKKQERLKMQLQRKRAYDEWVKTVAPPQLDSNKVGEMEERVQRLRDPAPRKTQRDRARARRPRRHKERKNFDENNAPAPRPYIRQKDPGSSVSDRGGYMPRGKSTSPVPKAPSASKRGVRGQAKNRGRSISPLEFQQQQQQQQQQKEQVPAHGLSHPEDLTQRAEQLAARARELRGADAPEAPPVKKGPGDFVTEELQHQKLQNMYLESISKQMERLATEEGGGGDRKEEM